MALVCPCCTDGTLLFILYILLGGRSGVIFVLLTIVLYQIVRLSARPKILRMVLFGLLSIVILGLQANFRDMGEIDMDSYEHSLSAATL